jgi:Leucine rich repeat
LFYRITFLTIPDNIASESYQYFRDGSDGPHNVYESSKDDKAKRLVCVRSLEAFKDMVFLEYLPNLEKIDANTCGISEINYDLHVKSNYSEPSIYLKNLATLDLSVNNITFIKQHCFYSLKENLETLNLSSNFITGFSPKAFYDLAKLEFLDLSNNSISFINETSFKDLRQLKNFSIANNKILKLDYHLFLNSTRLQTLNFRNNNIEMINFYTSSIWGDLMILDLSDNLISINEQFSNLTQLNFSILVPQFDHSIEMKNIIMKYNQMLLMVIFVLSILSIVAIILTVKVFYKTNFNNENRSKSNPAQSPIEINPIYESMME